MLKFIVRRLLYMIPILIVVSLVTFLLFNVAGGDPAAQAAGRYATPEQVHLIRAQMGLDKPLYLQYFDLLRQMITFDFGRSWANSQQISQRLREGVGPSLTVTVPGFLLSLFITIPLALVAAHRRNSFFDKATLVSCLALTSVSSVVTFWTSRLRQHCSRRASWPRCTALRS